MYVYIYTKQLRCIETLPLEQTLQCNESFQAIDYQLPLPWMRSTNNMQLQIQSQIPVNLVRMSCFAIGFDMSLLRLCHYL